MTKSIDELLEQYLGLLDEYTRLRSSLSSFQANIYHDIARANFSAERGLRYGQDQFDDRMQAIRRVQITAGDVGPTSFIIGLNGNSESEATDDSADNPNPKTPEEAQNTEGDGSGTGKSEISELSAKQSSFQTQDPLRWFGVLTPMPLRQAQKHAIRAVEEVIPRLASLSIEMADLEIQVGRARKRRAKDAAAAAKTAAENEKQSPPVAV
jgi:coiled-coil domain-containing protein 115